MVMPLLLVSVLPKLISDPETKKELEEVRQSMNVQQTMPEMSEIMANLFGGGVAGMLTLMANEKNYNMMSSYGRLYSMSSSFSKRR